MEQKRCTDCSAYKDASEFPTRKGKTEGSLRVSKKCRCCFRLAARQYTASRPAESIAAERNKAKMYREKNREACIARQKTWAIKNSQKVAEKKRAWAKANPKKVKELARASYLRNKENLSEARRVRYREDPLFALKIVLRNRLSRLLRMKSRPKTFSGQEVLGCSISQLYEHLQNQFAPGMSWENRGTWHVDHVVPLSSAKNESDLKALCHFSNLQPLWGRDNISKGAKVNPG